MASDIDSKQNDATCSNKTKPKYKPVSNNTVTQSIRQILLFSQSGITYKIHNTLQKLTKINY